MGADAERPKRKHNQTRQPVGPRVYAIRDDSPLTNPDTSQVVSGQLEPGLIVHACPVTKEGREVLGSRSKQEVVVINQDGGGSGASGVVGDGQADPAAEPLEIPEE